MANSVFCKQPGKAVLRFVCHLFQECEQAGGVLLGVEAGGDEGGGFVAQRQAQGRVGDEGFEGVSDRGRVPRLYQKTRLTLLYNLRDARHTSRDDRQRGRARFGKHHRQAVAVGGQAENVAVEVQLFERGTVGLHVVVDKQPR